MIAEKRNLLFSFLSILLWDAGQTIWHLCIAHLYMTLGMSSGTSAPHILYSWDIPLGASYAALQTLFFACLYVAHVVAD